MAERTATVVAEARWLMSFAKVYRLSEYIRWETLEGHQGTALHVVVSAVSMTPDHGRPEVMAWASDGDGEFLAGEDRGLPVATVRGEYRHDAALEQLGFRVVPGDQPPRRIVPARDDGEEISAKEALREMIDDYHRLLDKLDGAV